MKPPLPHSYWVEPGRLVAGEHPVGNDNASTRARLQQLRDAGVRGFLDLTEPGERPDYRHLLPPDTHYENQPLPDHSVPRSGAQMAGILTVLERLLAHGGVYVHCRAGIGRTGTTVGCYLRAQGAAPREALNTLNRLWQQNARAAQWPTVPETEEQEAFVLAWEPGGAVAPAVRRAAPVTASVPARSVRQQRFRGCLLGLAVGDVLASSGAAQGAMPWTDDTAIALCAVESLLARQGFDGRDQLERYRGWARDPAAAGAAPGSAPREVVRGVMQRALLNRSAVQGSHDPAHEDPSPLARCAAAALFAAGDVPFAVTLGADVARVTHQMPLVVDACRVFSAMLAQALSGSSRERVLDAARDIGGAPLHPEVRALAAAWLAPPGGRRRPPAGVLGALDSVARSFQRGRSFGDGMERALLGRGGDLDAECAAYGALAGAFHGERDIPDPMRARVAGSAHLTSLADQLDAGVRGAA